MQHISRNMHADVCMILQDRRASVDELGVHAPSAHTAPQFSSLPTNRGRDPVPISLSAPYDSGVTRTEENQSLMASIADALSQSHRGFSLEEPTSPGLDEPVPKYEAIASNVGRSAQSEPHGPATNGYVGSPPVTEEGEGQWPRRATRRSTSPPSLPPGAAPAAIRAWDDRMGQGEDGAHSDRPASSSARVPSQRLISSSERDGEEEDCLAYDRESRSMEEEGRVGGDGKHHEEDTLSESGGEANVDATATNYDEQSTTPVRRSLSTGGASNVGDATSLSRAGSQWRIPRVPPPSVDADPLDTHQTAAHKRQSLHSTGTGAQEDDEEIQTDESADERSHNAAAAREVSRAMDELEFSAVAPPSTSSSGYVTPRGPPAGYGSAFSAQSQAAAPHPRVSPPLSPSLGTAPHGSLPPSPILPPNPPFANRGWGGASPMVEARPFPGHHHTSSESIPGRLPTPTPTPTSTGVGALTAPRPTSPKYRSPPPDYPRPTPPFSSPLMASSTSSLNGGSSPGGGPRTISAAAFKRQQARSPSGTEPGPADTSPLTFRKPSVSPSPSSRQSQKGSGPPAPATGGLPRARLSVVNPDPRGSDEEEEEGRETFDYIAAYGGESAGYGAGRYVSDLEKS